VSVPGPIRARVKPVVLVVEDDRALREGLVTNLRMRHYETLAAADGEEGMRLAFDARPDLIVLDILLPHWSGLDVVEELRKRGERVPVLILSARDTIPDKVRGLGLGADDYLTKPFDLSEFLARVEALLRRGAADASAKAAVLTAGDVVLDPGSREVAVAGRPVALSAREFDLLHLLASSPGQVFSRETILERVWGWDYEGTARTVDNFIAGLRKKLGLGRRTRASILTVPCVGYKFDPGVAAAR
jgi:DNA-binding response OmpR family regulator